MNPVVVYSLDQQFGLFPQIEPQNTFIIGICYDEFFCDDGCWQFELYVNTSKKLLMILLQQMSFTYPSMGPEFVENAAVFNCRVLL